eukprot:TRINITY_DN11707_c0_g1_i2.p1 TRINITY_DN11707_c0_g1~~TRINITY_DN11707_c0_g1_i2.p1  ORF type:complete len:386 (+),score=50.33 TRINITY_DN11707_c0_g1_i2:406-1563(+)
MAFTSLCASNTLHSCRLNDYRICPRNPYLFQPLLFSIDRHNSIPQFVSFKLAPSITPGINGTFNECIPSGLERIHSKTANRRSASTRCEVHDDKFRLRAAQGQTGSTASLEGTAVDGNPSREVILAKVDKCLAEGAEEEALSLIRSILGQTGGLRGFGAARLLPRRNYSLDELRLNKIDTKLFLAPRDATLGGIQRGIQLAAVLGMLALAWAWEFDGQLLLGVVVAFLFIGTADQVANGGGGEALILDTLGNVLSSRYRARVARHEAGHFLIAYLVGILPRAYSLSSWQRVLASVQPAAPGEVAGLQAQQQAGTQFVDVEFQKEVRDGQLSSGTLDRFTCVALAGVASEYLKFGMAEGGLADIQMVRRSFRAGKRRKWSTHAGGV